MKKCLFGVAVSGMTGWKAVVASFEVHVYQYRSTGSNTYSQYVTTDSATKGHKSPEKTDIKCLEKRLIK
jgi:hypothetical protein